MSDARRYVDARVPTEETGEVLARALSWVHGYNMSHEGANLAVSLPGFQQGEVDEKGRLSWADPGHVVRVFGTTAQLEEFLASDGPRKSRRFGDVSWSPVSVIPEVFSVESFSRNRTIGKSYKDSSYARRQEARAKAQGREFVLRKPGVCVSTARFETRSVSNGQVFMLDVKRSEAVEGTLMFSSVNMYGLSAQGSSTPRF